MPFLPVECVAAVQCAAEAREPAHWALPGGGTGRRSLPRLLQVSRPSRPGTALFDYIVYLFIYFTKNAREQKKYQRKRLVWTFDCAHKQVSYMMMTVDVTS